VPSIGSVGDCDNALAEAVNALYKSELIRGPGQGPWRTVDDVELATLAWSTGTTPRGCTVTWTTCRNAMKTANTSSIPLYPELRDCPAPSAERVLKIFASVSRHMLCDPAGRTLKVFEPALDRLQLQILGLLGIPTAAYTLAGQICP
jgi:hypothetical protein